MELERGLEASDEVQQRAGASAHQPRLRNKVRKLEREQPAVPRGRDPSLHASLNQRGAHPGAFPVAVNGRQSCLAAPVARGPQLQPRYAHALQRRILFAAGKARSLAMTRLGVAGRLESRSGALALALPLLPVLTPLILLFQS